MMLALGFIGLLVGTPDARFEAVRHHVVNPPPGVSNPAAINAWVDRKVTWRADRKDEWASPRETLARGYGDCEDIALVKWAALRATGYKPLFLIVRDGRAYHAVVMVGGRVLDVAGRRSADGYVPVTGWTAKQRWLFGKGRS